MKIALVVQRFPHGGAESYVEQVATRLHKSGHDVVVISSARNPTNKTYDFNVIRLPSILSLGEYSFWTGLGSALSQGFDLVHINSYGYFHSDYAAHLKTKLHYKLVMTSHGFAGMEIRSLRQQGIAVPESPFGHIRGIYDKHIGKRTVLSCDALIALSSRDAEYYTNFGCKESRISIIPPGIKSSFFSGSDNHDRLRAELDADLLLLSVGELNLVKAQAVAIKAMPHILPRKPKAKLIIIGNDRTELQNLMTLRNKLGVEKEVFFLGPKNESEVKEYMYCADIMVHTSLSEGLSTVLLEAMSCGLPFITTPAGGNGALAQQSKAGITIPFNDSKSLADTVMSLSEDKQMLQTLGRNGRMYATDLSWDKVFPRIMNVYDNCLEET